MYRTALDDVPMPPSAKLLGWRLLDVRPWDGWLKVGFDGRAEFCNRLASSRAASSRPCSTTVWDRRSS